MGKTLENIFIEQYEDMKEKLSQANKTIFELSNKRKKDEEPVVFKTFSKECCSLKVYRDYEIIGSSIFKELTANDVKEIIDNEVTLNNYANMICDYSSYDRHKFVSIDTRVFPYTSKIQGRIILLEAHEYNNNLEASCYVMGNKNNLCTSKYFDINEKNRLYKYGLGKFKKELENVYKKKLKEEQSNV